MGVLTQEQVDRFRDDGFLVIPDLLLAEEVNQLADSVRTEFEGQRHIDKGKKLFPEPWTYTLSEESLRLADLRHVVDRPQITGAVSQLLEDEIRLSSFIVYAKPPGAPGTSGDYYGSHESAHCDYKPFRPAGSSLRWLFVIVPLVDYTDEVGPLLVSPGSHKIPKLTRKGRITHVERAQGNQIKALVNTNLRRGHVALVDMFVWHEAHGNRSDQSRFGVYNKYRARSAPPGCGPYLFRENSADGFDSLGKALLENRIAGRIAETQLLVEQGERFLVIDGPKGTPVVPGGAAQPTAKPVGTDDDNVIGQLNNSVTMQLGGVSPWVSYVGDFPLDESSADVSRVYACPYEELQLTNGADLRNGRWYPFDAIGPETGDRYLSEAAERWLKEPVLRGIGESNAQTKKQDLLRLEKAEERLRNAPPG